MLSYHIPCVLDSVVPICCITLRCVELTVPYCFYIRYVQRKTRTNTKNNPKGAQKVPIECYSLVDGETHPLQTLLLPVRYADMCDCIYRVTHLPVCAACVCRERAEAIRKPVSCWRFLESEGQDR